MKHEIMILGATGRTGRAVATRLGASGVSLVLAGRSRERLAALSAELGGAHRIEVGSLESNLATLATDAPGVVVNTVGPFAETSVRIAQACPPGTHYLDISNEFAPVEGILALTEAARAAGQVLVTGAGFGVLGTESAVLRACAGQTRPSTVRVDALPALALEAGRIGAALAGSIVEVLEFGGREVRGGRMVRAATASHPARITTPDGDDLFTASGANGELLAAWNASGADVVIAASTAVPSNLLVRRAVLPLLGIIVRIPGVPALLRRVVAGVKLKAAPMSRTSSWGHARVEWSSGIVRESWLRVGDAGDFTADVMAEVARRLLNGEGRPGAFTPGALFGFELAESVGAEFTVVQL